jgi:hypothetical protein
VKRAEAVLSALGSEGMLPRGRCQRFGAASGAGAGLNFLAGKSDLPAVVKTALARLLFSGPLEFDAERDLLVDVPVVPVAAVRERAARALRQYAEIAAAQAAYSAAAAPARICVMGHARQRHRREWQAPKTPKLPRKRQSQPPKRGKPAAARRS